MFQAIITTIFLLITVILLPWLAYLSAKQPPIKAEQQATVLLQSIVIQIILAFIGLATWSANKLAISWLNEIEISNGLVVPAITGVAFIMQWLNFKFLPRSESSALFHTSTFRLESLKHIVYFSAAIGEEIVYRGVMFALFVNYFGSAFFSATLVAILFALSHLKQGAKGFLFSFIISMLLQLCLLQTGIIVTAITHYIVNLIPDLLIRLSKRST